MNERSTLSPEELGEGLYYGFLHLVGEHAPALRAVFQGRTRDLPERLDDRLAEEMLVLGILLMIFHLVASNLEEEIRARVTERLLTTVLEKSPVDPGERPFLAEELQEGMEAYREAIVRWIEEEKEGEVGRRFLERLPLKRPTRREIQMTELYLLQYAEVLRAWLRAILDTFTLKAGETTNG